MKDDRARSRRQMQATHKRDRNRLGFLAVTLAIVLFAYFQIGKAKSDHKPETTDYFNIESVISLPPIEQDLLVMVKDDSDMERRILEPEPFRHLARMSQALHAGHLRSLGEPALPFALLKSDPANHRGKAFRVRGELLDTDITTRSPGAPQEFWCRLRTDQGEEVLFVSMKVPDDLFGAENYVRADGFFFKNYTWSIGGEQYTAPLLIGREIVPSWRESGALEGIDLMLLNTVRDHRLGESEDLDEAALWHLLGHARWMQENDDLCKEVFDRAPEMDLDFLKQLAAEPELFRGKPIQVPGRVPDNSSYRWGEIAGENPLRATWLRYGYLGNLAFSDHPILLVGTDEMDFSGNRGRWYFGYFLQLKGYIDRENNPRRAPVFVVCGYREADRSTPPIVAEMIWWFIGIGVAAGAFMFWAAASDRKSARAAAVALSERRRNRDNQNNGAGAR